QNKKLILHQHPLPNSFISLKSIISFPNSFISNQKIVTDSPYSPSPDCQTMSFAFYCCGTNQSMPPPGVTKEVKFSKRGHKLTS
ncbi:hypothetical protein KSS87_014057, partial [Heliosperma pusillum]